MKETMNQFMCSPLIYKLFVFVETMQMLYFTMHPQIHFEFTIIMIEYFRQVIQYLQLNYLIDAMDQSQTIIIMYCFFGIQFAIIFLIFIGVHFVYSKKKISTFTSYSFKIISFYALLCNTILNICFINIFLVLLICNPNSQYSFNADCYNGMNILHTVIGAFGFLLFLILQYYFITFYSELKPTSEVPFAQSQSRFDYAKLLTKIIILVYITIDYNGEYAKTYLVALSVVFFWLMIVRFIEPQHFQRDVFHFLIFCDTTQFTLALAYTLHKYLDLEGSDDVGFYFILTSLPFMYYCNLQVVHKKVRYLLNSGLRNLSDPNLHEQYFNQLIYIIEKREDQLNYILLESVLVQHMENCNILECSCHSLRESKLKEQEEIVWFQLLIQLIDYSLSKFNKCGKLYVLQSYVEKDKLKNKFKCYYGVIHLKQLDPSLREEYYGFRTIRDLEDVMLEEDQRAEIVVDVGQVVKFQKHYGEFQVRLEESVKRHYEFWSELMETNPDIQKLYSLGSSITQSVEDVKETYDKLIGINSNHVMTLRVYGKFQYDVINNDQFGTRITEKAEQIEKALSTYTGDSSQDKYGENSQTSIMTCSAEMKTLGQILSCNKEIEILGYHKYELIGQNVTRLMPKCYANHHDKFMIRYLETNQPHVVGIERTVMCLNKFGAMVPASLLFKVLPILNKGIRMVSFIKLVKIDFYYIAFDPQNYQIFGMTQNCQVQFGLPLNLVYGNQAQSSEFTMESILQDFKILQDKMAIVGDNVNLSAFNLTLDSTRLGNQFLLDDSANLSEDQFVEHELDIEEKKKLSPFRVQKIKCHLQKQTYQDMNIIVLKFSEYVEQVDLGKSLHQNDFKYMKSKTKTKASSDTQRKKNQSVNHVNEDYLNEDRSSVNSVQSSLNDDMRRLKDFKAMMSEKQVPRNIRTIQVTMLSLTLILLTVSIIDLVLKDQQNNQFTMSTQAISYSYTRDSQISSLLLFSRLLQLIGTGQYNRTTEQSIDSFELELKSTSLNRVKYIQELQFQLVQLTTDFKKTNINLPTTKTYSFTKLLQENDTIDYSLTITDGVRALINSVVVLDSIDLSYFNSTEEINPADQAFYFINYNGLRNIRIGTELRNQEFMDFFKQLIDSKFVTFLILMIISIIILIATHAIVMPILFNVDTTNNKVLSMFGLITVEDIRELAVKCEDFLQNYIEDFKEKRELENKIKEDPKVQPQQDKNYIEVNNEDDHVEDEEEIRKHKEEEEEKARLERERVEAEKQRKYQEQKQKNRYLRKKDRKKHKYQVQEIELTEAERERVEKLERSTSKQETSTLGKFLLFFILFTGFFIVQLVLEVLYINTMNQVINHQSLANQRYPVMMYRILFGLEDVLENQNIYIDGEWVQKYYHNQIYDVERDVFESFKQYTNQGFSQYKQYYDWMNFNDMCQNVTIFTSQDVSISQEECTAVQNGILTKGLRTSVINLALYANDTLKLGYDVSNILNGDVMHNILLLTKYQRAAFSTLCNVFLQDSVDYISSQQVIEIIKFVILIVSWIILFFLIWMPYLTKLSMQIWQTKGMLNMIPMSIIQKNEKLKYRFLQDNIIKMVQ